MRFAGDSSPVVGAAALQWLVLATASFLPFVDLPQHVAQAQLLVHLREPAVARLYEAQLAPQVNVLALFTLAPALAVLPEGAAVRALLALYLGGLAFALWRLTRAVGTSAWAAAAALLFAVHFNVWYGFLSFCLGLPLFMWLVARWASAWRAVPSARWPWRTLATDALLWWLILLGHLLLFAFAMASFALWVAWGPRRGARGRRALAALPALAWFAAWTVTSRSAVATQLPPGGGIEALWEGPSTKLGELGRALLVATQPGTIEWIVLGGVGLVVAALTVPAFVSRMRSDRAGDARRTSLELGATNDGLAHSRRWVLAVGALGLAAYAFLPYSIYERDRVTSGLFVLYPRFAALAPLFVLPTLGSPASRRARFVLAVAIVAAHVALAVSWRTALARVGREAAPIDAAIAAPEPGRVLKSLVFTPYPDGLRYEAFLHVASYYQARRMGETDQSFAALLPSPVHYRDLRRPYLSLQDEHVRPETFDPSRAGLYDYLLVYHREGAVATDAPALFARSGWRIEGPLRSPGPPNR